MKQNSLSLSDLSEYKQEIKDGLSSFASKKILLIGDLCLDEYVYGEVKRISPEAPVPVVEVIGQEYRIGLAGQVAQNIVSLGGQVKFVSVIGNDATAKDVIAMLSEAGVSSDHLIIDEQRPTIRKSRIMAGPHHIVRVDYEKRKFLSLEAETKVIQKVERLIKDCDGVIIEDYAKGVISESVAQAIIKLCHEFDKKVLVDPHITTPLKYYKGAHVLTPNVNEAVALSGIVTDDLRESGQTQFEIYDNIFKKSDCELLIVTRGKEGMNIMDTNSLTHLPTYAQKVFDVTGAGDAVIAALSLGISSGLSIVGSCVMANCAAGVVVSKLGCVPCSQQELLDVLRDI